MVLKKHRVWGGWGGGRLTPLLLVGLVVAHILHLDLGPAHGLEPVLSQVARLGAGVTLVTPPGERRSAWCCANTAEHPLNSRPLRPIRVLAYKLANTAVRFKVVFSGSPV